MQTQPPRIALISALAQSPGPAVAAMREAWSAAVFYNLLDESLPTDLAEAGALTSEITARFLTLGRYAAGSGHAQKTNGILFTCSAFGPAIDRVKADLPIPVVAPNEGAFEEALDLCRGAPGGGRVGLVLTFPGSLAPLSAEMLTIAAARGQAAPAVIPIVADRALAALQAGDADAHDRLIAEATRAMPPVDVLILGQFSMARAAPLIAAQRAEAVLTTPQAAVRKLKRLVESV